MTLGDLKRWPLSVRVMIGVAVALLFGIFAFYPGYSAAAEKSLAGWTWAACNSSNGFLHGRLIPFVFPWMIWWAWWTRKDDVVKPSYWGLVWMCFALLLFLASMRAVQPRWALFGTTFLVIGLVQYLFGGRIAKAVVFPAFFLWFMIPIPGLEAVVMGNWQVSVTQASYEVGNALGMDLVLSGSTIEVGGSLMVLAEG